MADVLMTKMRETGHYRAGPSLKVEGVGQLGPSAPQVTERRGLGDPRGVFSSGGGKKSAAVYAFLTDSWPTF